MTALTLLLLPNDGLRNGGFGQVVGMPPSSRNAGVFPWSRLSKVWVVEKPMWSFSRKCDEWLATHVRYVESKAIVSGNSEVR